MTSLFRAPNVVYARSEPGALQSDMLVTTVKEQRLIGRAARSSGGYFALARKVAAKRQAQSVKKKGDAGAKR